MKEDTTKKWGGDEEDRSVERVEKVGAIRLERWKGAMTDDMSEGIFRPTLAELSLIGSMPRVKVFVPKEALIG
jgi:hypothetical protein